MVGVGRVFGEVFAEQQAPIKGGVENALVGETGALPTVELVGGIEECFTVVVVVPFRHFFIVEYMHARSVESSTHPQEESGVSRSL